MDPEEQYEKWLEYAFGREVTTPEWYWDIDIPEFEATPQEMVVLVTRTLRRCGTDLVRYSDDQVGLGLNYMFNNACSNVAFAILEGAAPLEQRLEAIRAIGTLYSDCFARRCSPSLGHLSEPAASSRLGFICYMLWDVTPIAYWEGRPEANAAYDAILDVLAGALALPNVACVESALHGLGHVHRKGLDARIEAIIRGVEPGLTDERLRVYARAAARGCVL